MYNDQEKQKMPCEQKKQPLTDEEAKQASGGVSAPVAPSSRSGGASMPRIRPHSRWRLA